MNKYPGATAMADLTLRGLNFTWIRYKNSVCTSQETHRFSATNTSQLKLFREMVAVYCENQFKHTNTVFWENPELKYVKACGTYKNHWALKGLMLRVRENWKIQRYWCDDHAEFYGNLTVGSSVVMRSKHMDTGTRVMLPLTRRSSSDHALSQLWCKSNIK
jgi:hypothetical protein